MKDGFDYSEFENLAKKLVNKTEFFNWLENFLLTEANRVLANVVKRQRTYTYIAADGTQRIGLIDTGNMIRSWKIGEIEVVGDTLQVEIYNPVEYASYIEYGHHSFQGAYLLTIALDDIRLSMPDRFDKEFTKFLKERGVKL